MTRTRELIKEILEIRQRMKSDHTISELFNRMSALEGAFEKRSEIEPELLRYFPVALVACVEGFFRLAIKRIIDTGPPYIENAVKLLANIKFDYEFIKALHGKQITIGDFVSHQVPLSSLAHIQAHLSALLSKDFLDGLRGVSDRAAEEIHDRPKSHILTDSNLTYAAVSRTLELRHIICHELATNFSVTRDEIEGCFFNTTLFLKASEELVSETLQPGAPLTQADMNIAAAEELRLLLERVASLEAEISSRLGKKRTDEFALAASVWRTYMKSWAAFEADEYKGGTIWPTIYGGSAASIAKERIAQLAEYFEYFTERRD